MKPAIVVPNRNDIRLCVEIKCSNKAAIRLRHLSPTTDDIIIIVQGSCSFSKLGLKSGFHQHELSLSSHAIKTFPIKQKKMLREISFFPRRSYNMRTEKYFWAKGESPIFIKDFIAVELEWYYINLQEVSIF